MKSEYDTWYGFVTFNKGLNRYLDVTWEYRFLIFITRSEQVLYQVLDTVVFANIKTVIDKYIARYKLKMPKNYVGMKNLMLQYTHIPKLCVYDSLRQ